MANKWRTFGRYRIGADVRVILQVADRDIDAPSDTAENLIETTTTLRAIARLIRSLLKQHP